MDTISRKRKVDIRIPLGPNYIVVAGVAVSVQEFTERELRAIGRAWTEQLIKESNDKRKRSEK